MNVIVNIVPNSLQFFSQLTNFTAKFIEIRAYEAGSTIY